MLLRGRGKETSRALTSSNASISQNEFTRERSRELNGLESDSYNNSETDITRERLAELTE